MSRGEEKICQLLNQAHIKYNREQTFTDLRGGRFRYDFFIKQEGQPSVLIEYNGEQHYKMIKQFYRNEGEWYAARERDRQKISYALANDMIIYEIPYWELSKMQTAADLFQQRFRARTRWHNDEIIMQSK